MSGPQQVSLGKEDKEVILTATCQEHDFSGSTAGKDFPTRHVILPLDHEDYLKSAGLILQPANCISPPEQTDLRNELNVNGSSLEQRKYCKNIQSLLGIFLGLFSGLTNSIISLLVKFNDTRSIFEVSTYRYAVMVGPPTVLLIYHRKNPFALTLLKSVGWALVLRAVLGCGATFTRYYALQKLPLADASVIMFSSPVFVAIFSRLFLKEPFRWSHAVAIVVTLAGCILVSRPPAIFGTMVAEPSVDWNGRMWGYVAAMASAIFTASVFVTVRYMKTLDSNFVLFYMSVIGLIISAIVTAAMKQFAQMTNAKEIGALVGVGVLSWLSNECMVRALRRETANLIALLRTGDIVWAFIWQITIFKVMPHYFSIVGAVLVVLCVSCLSVKEAIAKLPAESRVRVFAQKMMQPATKVREKMTCKSKTGQPVS